MSILIWSSQRPKVATSAPIVKGPSTSEDDCTKPPNVCILGAGVAGFFTAMIFDYLNERLEVNVEYDTFKCDKERRGRMLCTRYFSEETDKFQSLL